MTARRPVQTGRATGPRRRATAAFAKVGVGSLIGYKVLRYDTDSGEAVSAADARIKLPLRIGVTHRMPGRGMFLASTRSFVLSYYLINDYNALVTYSFDRAHITGGDPADTESEFTVSMARVIDFEVLDEDSNVVIRSPLPARATATRNPNPDGVTINWHMQGKDAAYIEWFHVPPDARRRGDGTRAYRRWQRRLPPTVKLVRLHAADSGAGPSDSFWESLGFDYRYDFEELPDVSSRDYEASKEMQKGIRGNKTPRPIVIDDEDD